MASNRMNVKNAAQVALEEAATYGGSYGVYSAISAYAPDFLKTVTGYGQAYFGPVMPAIDAGVSVVARMAGSAVRGTLSKADVALNVVSGVAASYAVQSVYNVAGLDVSEVNPLARVALEASVTSATSRLLRFAGEKAATLSIFNRKSVNQPGVYDHLLEANGQSPAAVASEGADLEAQVSTAPRRPGSPSQS